MTPSRPHEAFKSLIGRLVEVWCLEHDIEFSTYRSWTLENAVAERGAEPDECYVFGDVPEPIRPDLAIEVVVTSGGIDKLEVYRALDVPEVWYLRAGKIEPYVLRAGRYELRKESACLAGLDLAQLASFLGRPSTSAAIREYRAALKKAP
jgi:Uma2 family endonuclease